MIFWLTPGVIVGGRLGYVLFYDTAILWTDPIEALKIWHGGMSFHGGLVGVSLVLILAAWRNHVASSAWETS